MTNPLAVARVTGARTDETIAALHARLGASVVVDTGPAHDVRTAIEVCRRATATTMVVRRTDAGASYVGYSVTPNGGDARTLVDLLRHAVEGGAEPLPDTVLDRWRTAVRAEPPAAGERYWQRLAALVPDAGIRPGQWHRSRRELSAEAGARLDERLRAGGEAGVLAYAAAGWLVTSERVTGEAVQALSLMVDRRSRAELARVVGHTYHWLPVVERLDPRTHFPALERAMTSASEIGRRWQEQIPDDFPPVATGIDVVAPGLLRSDAVDCEIIDLTGWRGEAPLTLRLVHAGGRWWLDLVTDGQPPDPLLAGWNHVLTSAADLPLAELALAADPLAVTTPAAAPDVVEAIENWQADQPNDIAIVDAHGEMTIGDLWWEAGELGRGITAGSAVGIDCERDRSFVVAALAVLRAGAQFIPLAGPGEGVGAMIVHDRLEVVHSDRSPANGGFAYAMRTSGSLGPPKLAVISRRTLAAASARVAGFVGVGPTDRYVHLAAFGFSSSIRQLFVPLTRRATVLLATEEQRTNAAVLLSWLEQMRPTIIDTTPTTLDATAEAAAAGSTWPGTVRTVLAASEQLTPTVVNRFRDATGYSGPILHMYGTTETSGLVAGSTVGSGPSYQLAPLPGCGFYIRDPHLHPLPAGLPGELYVDVLAGDDAYLDARTTAIAFVPSPRGAGARMVRTRDRVRQRPDGSVEWLGRFDDLVKIRAERVSLTGVAEIAQAHPAVARAFAIDAQGEVGIAVAVTRGAQLRVEDLQEFMRGRVLQAALPTRVAIVDQLPQNTSGKVDRRAVRELVTHSGDQRAPVVAPTTPTENALLELWVSVLPDRLIGVTDNFFDLGGHSLKAAQLAARARRGLECEAISVSSVFDHPTVRAMAAFVDAQRDDA